MSAKIRYQVALGLYDNSCRNLPIDTFLKLMTLVNPCPQFYDLVQEQ